ncbi:MAG TPA: sulfotransferase, partial [Candidatus Latescibacteria bacterium]|nr:sulfotransferase [Candidatus Latescibacterota bacterium]
MMPFEFGVYLRLWRMALAERRSGGMSPRRRRVVFGALLIAPLLALINAACFALDNLIFPGMHRVKVRAPLFIIGHARSGTSLMHRLMTRDEASFVYFRTYEMLLPSLMQKYLLRGLAILDRRLFASRAARALAAWENRTFAKGRQMHPMSLAGPEEDEFLLALSCASGLWMTLFPYPKALEDLYYFDQLPPGRRRRTMAFYRACLKRQLWLYGSDRTHCSKNPVFSGRVAGLIEAFPDARFVVNVRDPRETIPSLLKLVQSGWKKMDWEESRQRNCLRILAEQSWHSYRHPLQCLKENPETPGAVVDYRDLVSDPATTIEGVYRALGLPISDAFRKLLAGEGKRERGRRTE